MTRRIEAPLVVLALAVAPFPGAAVGDSAGGVTFLPLGDLPGGDFTSVARAVSADGSTVVGHSASAGSDPYEAFRWTAAEGMIGLGGLTSPIDTRGRGVSADGSAVVLSGSGGWPILWTDAGGLLEIADTTGTLLSAVPFDLSADGATIVGVTREAAEPANQAFRWTAATGFEPLGWLPSTLHDSFLTGASADGSVLTGFSFHHDGFDVEPMIWTEAAGLDSLGDVPGGDPYALAWGISGDGSTVVGDAHIGGTSEPWLWRETTGFVRPDPDHGASGGGWFEAVSADGSVAVGAPAIVYDAAHGIRRLADIVTDAGIDLSGWLLQTAYDVSADGRTIVGYGRNPAGNTEAWLIRIPDAATVVPVTTRASPAPAFALRPLGPNPTGATSVFRLTLPRTLRVWAAVFTVDGRRVRTLVDATMPPGEHDLGWDGTDDVGRRVVDGTYFLHASAAGHTATRRIVRVE